MTFAFDSAAVASIAALPAVLEAGQAGADLIALWPLTEAMHMENDAKYAENLQVRVTRTLATLMTGLDVTMPDAEFVYEGADEIPGRPQEIVDALLDANDAYDATAEYSESGDVREPLATAGMLGANWNAATEQAVAEVMAGVENEIAAAGMVVGRSSDAEVAGNIGAEDVTRRFAMVIAAVDAALGSLADNAAAGTAAAGASRSIVSTLPVIPYANELCERLGVPRLAPKPEQWEALVAAQAEGGAGAVANLVAPLAAAEWRAHRVDVLWDPDEAKKRAREEDERKNKEALAAKFAHVKNDNKETVEL